MTIAVAAASVSCGDGNSTSGSFAPAFQSADLLFGLKVIDGMEPIGRPGVVDEPAFFFKGKPVDARKLHAAFWVTADDPVEVVRAWVEQLDQLTLDEVKVERGYTRPEQLIQVTG